jgi:hypothetical protein
VKVDAIRPLHHHLRANGGIMDNNDRQIFKLLQGLKPVDASALTDFAREMADEAIPEMLREVEKRRMLAAESRHRQLEMPTSDLPETPT